MSCPKNISVFFKPSCMTASECCTVDDENDITYGHSSTHEVSAPLSELCQKKWNSKHSPNDYAAIRRVFTHSSVPMFATTITFGRKYYWQMSNKEQYKVSASILQAYVRERKSSCFYIAEVNQSGVIHWHGVDCVDSFALFAKRFTQFGRHNESTLSYQPVGDIQKYMDYMFKDQYQPVGCAYNDEQACESTVLSTDKKYYGKKAWIFKYKPIYCITKGRQ